MLAGAASLSSGCRRAARRKYKRCCRYLKREEDGVYSPNGVYGDIYACLCVPTRVSLLANILTSSVPRAAKFLWGLYLASGVESTNRKDRRVYLALALARAKVRVYARGGANLCK